jgi:hypothetical protein
MWGLAPEDRPSQTTPVFYSHNTNIILYLPYTIISDSSSPHPTNDHGGRRHDRIIV